jgi:enoyl-CoA hydratase
MEQQRFENLLYEVRDGAAWITVNREAKLNALNRQTVEELATAADAAIGDPAAAVLVVTGAGEKAFVAGADIREMAGLGAAEAQSFSRFLHRSLDRLERSPKPVIAAVNGFALGGGCELALACHLRIAARSAKFGQPEVNLGLIPGAGGTQRLPRVVGRGRALQMILGGRMIDAAEALDFGLANAVVPDAELRTAVGEWVREIAGKSRIALSRALEAVMSGAECAQDEALRMEAALFGLCFATEDMREGTRAFLEKRKPAFPGR